LTIFQSVVIGVVQGLTEFLPISSTAHLRIVPALFGWGDPGAAFTAVIQLGTLVAILLYFSIDIFRITRAVIAGLFSGRLLKDPDSRIGWMIAIGTIPIVVFGLVFKHSIETSLRSLYVIAGSMIVLALFLIFAEYVLSRKIRRGVRLKSIERLSWKDVILVGFAQSVALIPGSSRSGTTITGGLLVGMDRETAARFSFLLSLPSLFAAGIFELIKEREALLSIEIGMTNLIVATVVSGVVGYASIAFLLGYLRKHSTYLFIIYRIVVGIALLILVQNGIVAPN
jgi:undecaprenyl-diphosphatase